MKSPSTDKLIKKIWCTHTYTHTQTHTQSGILVMKSMKFCHWQNMDGPKENYVYEIRQRRDKYCI